MNLDKIINVEKGKLSLDTVEFDNIKGFIKDKDKDILPIEDIKLNNAIDSMLNRWKVSEGKEKDKLKDLCVKLYHGRLNDKKSRIFWYVLRENVSAVLE